MWLLFHLKFLSDFVDDGINDNLTDNERTQLKDARSSDLNQDTSQVADEFVKMGSGTKVVAKDSEAIEMTQFELAVGQIDDVIYSQPQDDEEDELYSQPDDSIV